MKDRPQNLVAGLFAQRAYAKYQEVTEKADMRATDLILLVFPVETHPLV